MSTNGKKKKAPLQQKVKSAVKIYDCFEKFYGG